MEPGRDDDNQSLFDPEEEGQGQQQQVDPGRPRPQPNVLEIDFLSTIQFDWSSVMFQPVLSSDQDDKNPFTWVIPCNATTVNGRPQTLVPRVAAPVADEGVVPEQNEEEAASEEQQN